jgi:hypothetical protein
MTAVEVQTQGSDSGSVESPTRKLSLRKQLSKRFSLRKNKSERRSSVKDVVPASPCSVRTMVLSDESLCSPERKERPQLTPSLASSTSEEEEAAPVSVTAEETLDESLEEISGQVAEAALDDDVLSTGSAPMQPVHEAQPVVEEVAAAEEIIVEVAGEVVQEASQEVAAAETVELSQEAVKENAEEKASNEEHEEQAPQEEESSGTKVEDKISEILNGTPAELVTMKVLLLAPSVRKFELVCIECTEDTTVQSILDDLMLHVTSDDFTGNQRYSGLCRQVECSVQELDLGATINVYDLEYDQDILIAIPEATEEKVWSAQECCDMGDAILKHDSMSQPAPVAEEAEAKVLLAEEEEEVTKSSNGSWMRTMIKLAFVATFAGVFQGLVTEHMRIIEPLGAGSVLKAGEFRSQCGLIEQYVPAQLLQAYGSNVCTPATMEFSEGKVSYYQGFNKELVWEMTPNKKVTAKEMEMTVDPSGKVLISGVPTKIRFVGKRTNVMENWPFSS